MTRLHRGSQKRMYTEGVEYFVTTVTHDRHPYFKEPILAELFIRDLWFAHKLKEFESFGYTVMPDHVHLLFQPRGTANYLTIMGTLKRNVARDINDILRHKPLIRDLIEGDDSAPQAHQPLAGNRRLRMNYDRTKRNHPGVSFEAYSSHFAGIDHLRMKFKEHRGVKLSLPAFRWQTSFRDHVIRDEEDYLNHLEYIYNNALKHGLVHEPEQYLWMWIVGMKQPFAPD